MKAKELKQMDSLFDRLYPICRSIMGEGQRETLDILSEYMPLEMINFKTGEKVLNWEIPQEWVIRDAWIKDSTGKKIIDFKDSNLHVINYSQAVDKEITLEELQKNIYSRSDLPEAIPYITSYYKRRWGFCMEHTKYEKLTEGNYHAYIDSEHIDGNLQIGHSILEGEGEKEIVISSYTCHPSMANNELSGPIVLAFLYNRIKNWDKRKFTYRFILNPETIGSIAYLSKYREHMIQDMYSGMILTCVGGNNEGLSYKQSRRSNAPIDNMINHLNKFDIVKSGIREFTPAYGSDERQYCSPGFNLPMGQITKTPYAWYKEYHTSLDNKELMGIENLQNSLDQIEIILRAIEVDGYYINKFPHGEVKLDKYDLYPDMNGYFTSAYSNNEKIDGRTERNCILNILNYSDGQHTLMEIAEKCSVNILDIATITEKLKDKGLIEGPYLEERSL